MEGNEPVDPATARTPHDTFDRSVGDNNERKGDPAKRQAGDHQPTAYDHVDQAFHGDLRSGRQKTLNGRLTAVKGDNNTPRIDIDGRL